MFDNGSMKIVGNQLDIKINNLPQFIEDNFKYSPNKDEYLNAAQILQTSEDKPLLKNAILKLRMM